LIINLPLVLVCVDKVDGEDQHYLCCFADCSGRPYNTEELLAIPVPRAFDQLRELIPLGDLHWLVEPRATFSSYDRSGDIREDNRIGAGHGLNVGAPWLNCDWSIARPWKTCCLGTV
jgi:hypothetical protein